MHISSLIKTRMMARSRAAAGRAAICRASRRRAMTLMEVMFASSLFILVSTAVLGLVTTTAHHLKRSYSFAGSMQTALMARDQIRYKLSMARFGSVAISDDGKEVTYWDPNLGPDVESAFRLSGSYLMYKKGTSDSPDYVRLTGPLDDLNFYFEGNNDIIGIVTMANGWEKYYKGRPISFDTVVYLRN